MARSKKVDPVGRNRPADSDDSEAGPSRIRLENPDAQDAFSESEDNGSENGAQDGSVHGDGGKEEEGENDLDGFGDGMDLEGFSGLKEKVVKPLTPEALAAFKSAKEKTGVIYISRIPPGMKPTKVRHLMSQYGETGKVYLQQEDAKRAYLRRKYTSTRKPHFTEGWVEFKDKKVARSVAAMLNATSIGGKKGTRFRDDVWTMKYLPKFKWDMLTEQIAHEAAVHQAKLRAELSQSRKEQRDYLKNVELARVLEKRTEKKLAEGKEPPQLKRRQNDASSEGRPKKSRNSKEKAEKGDSAQLSSVLDSIF